MNNKLYLFIGHAIFPAVFLTALTPLDSIHIKLELVFILWIAIITAGLYVLAHLGLEAREKIHMWIHKDFAQKVDFTFFNISALVFLGLGLAIIQSVYIIGCILGIITILIFVGIDVVISYIRKRISEKRVRRSCTSKVLKEI